MYRQIFVYLYSFKFFKRLIPSLIRKVSLNNTWVKILINDFKIKLFLKSSIDREIFLKNEYEEAQLTFIKNVLKVDKFNFFFDIGAYIGFYSLSLCKLVDKTVAFEPNFQNYQRLTENIKINNFKVNHHNIGCSDNKKILKLWYTDKNKRGGSSIYQEEDNEIRKYDKKKILYEQIKTDKLDNLYNLRDKKILFKIDVERHELNVLKGAANLISKNKCYMQIEIFPHLQEKTLFFLNDYNFKLLHRINNDFYLKNY